MIVPLVTSRSVRTRCGDGCPLAPARAAGPAARRCHPAPDRCACPRAGDRQSRRHARGGGAAKHRAGRRCAPGRGPGPPRAIAGSGRARAAWSYGPGGSFRPKHLDAPRIRNANVNRVERTQPVSLPGLTVALERDGVAWAREVRPPAVPPKLAREVRAHRRHRADRGVVAGPEPPHAARGLALALTLPP